MKRYSGLALALSMLAGMALTSPSARADEVNGVVRVKSIYSVAETIARIKTDVEAKKIKFFDEINQSKLAADAGIELKPSTLLLFGNPPLGIQFLTSNPEAGLDWPVRVNPAPQLTGASFFRRALSVNLCPFMS
jgi:hypothetical protein